MASLSATPANWTRAIHDTATQFMNADVCFYEEVGGGEYNPITGAGGDPGVSVTWRGKARVQQLRSAQKFATDYQAEANRTFRFQLDPDDNVPFLPQGAKARVLSAGGGDVHLEELVFVVDSAINASHQAVKTVELTATMDRQDWQWPVMPTVRIDAVESRTGGIALEASVTGIDSPIVNPLVVIDGIEVELPTLSIDFNGWSGAIHASIDGDITAVTLVAENIAGAVFSETWVLAGGVWGAT